jgi:hypothetical protein
MATRLATCTKDEQPWWNATQLNEVVFELVLHAYKGAAAVPLRHRETHIRGCGNYAVEQV